MEKILKLNKVNKRFGGVVTALDVCMELEPGAIHGLIGPNGAGKTTLLNLISGIYEVDSGSITFMGRDITHMPSHERAHLGLGRTFQTPRFLERSNIEENLLVAADLGKRVPFWKSFISRKSLDFLDDLEHLTQLAGFSFCLEDEMDSLTFGQKKLLEIIRAILTHPKVILVDEPAAGLNNREIENAVKLLEMTAQEMGIGIILIEHSMDMIMNVCQQITVLNFGEVIACGTPAQVSSNEDVITAYLGRERNVES